MLTNNLVSPRINNVQGTDSLDGKSMSIQKLTDEELVAKYKESRDHQYLTELFTRHSDVIYRNALRKMKNPADAEDIMQTAYIKMVTDILNFKGTGSVKGWMLQVVIFTCYDRLRSEKSRQNRDKKIMSERTQMTTPKNYELTEMIETHLNKLPEIYKLPITLQIMDGLTVKEVSDALKIPEKTIRSQIARGLEKLKVSLQSVGVTASIISLGDMLKGIQQPMAPEMFKSSQYFNALLQNKAATSTKLAISAGSKGVTLQKVVSGTMLSLLASCFIVLGYYLYKPKIEPAPMKFKKWDFENATDFGIYQDIGLLKGSISIVDPKGLKNSNCLEIAQNSALVFNISDFKLPIKLSYEFDILLLGGKNKGVIVFKDNYLEDKNILNFHHLEMPTDFDPSKISRINNNSKPDYLGNWRTKTIYISEDCVDIWQDGKRISLIFGQSLDNKKLLIEVRDNMLMDNLIVQSIDQNELPDYLAFKNYASNLSFEKGFKEYKLEKEIATLKLSEKSFPSVSMYDKNSWELATGLLGKSKQGNSNNFKTATHEISFPYIGLSNKVEWVRPLPKTFQKWDFENNQNLPEYHGFGLVRGAITIDELRGINNSKALVTDKNTLMSIDISQFKLPLKVSYKTELWSLSNEDSFLQKITWLNYAKPQSIFYLFNLIERFNIKLTANSQNVKLGFTGIWLSIVAYIDENNIDFWINGKRSYFLQGTSADKKNLYFFTKNKAVIDDLKIESINPKELPDKTLLEDSIYSFVFKDGIDLYSLDKEKLGLDKNGKFQPKMSVDTVERFEETLGVKDETIYPKLTSANKVAWAREQQNKMLSWNFEDLNQINDFNLIRGSLTQVGELGEKGSMCMGVKEDSLIEFDISRFKLPLKITYSYDSAPKSDETTKGVYMIKGNYQKDKNIFYFTNLSPTLKVDATNLSKLNKSRNYGFLGKWFSATIYVSEECIDLWFDGNRKTLVYGKSNDNQKLFLQFLDKTLIDNLVIESVSQESIPDVSSFSRFVVTVPFVKGYKQYYKLGKEKEILGINQSSEAELGICDSEVAEKSLNLQNKYMKKVKNLNTEELKAQSVSEFLNNSK